MNKDVIIAKISKEDYQKVLDASKQGVEAYKPALKELSESERKEFYRFFVVEYYMTGEGVSYWFKICRNYPPYDGEDNDLESFKKFIDNSYFSQYIEQPTEKEFMRRYANLIPEPIVKMIEHEVQPEFIWESHFHVNYS